MSATMRSSEKRAAWKAAATRTKNNFPNSLLFVVLLLAFPAAMHSFVVPPHPSSSTLSRNPTQLGAEQAVSVDCSLNEERARALFAWISRAFVGDRRYDNLMLAVVAIFGDLPNDSQPRIMAQEALKLLPQDDEALMGEVISLADREYSSLGAMGAAQWTGRFRTRPHALLQVSNFTCVDDWIQGLPRGVKRTLKKANAQNFTVTSKPIRGDQPAPHSSLAHFNCVLEHEVRLLAYSSEAFMNALGAAVGRYVETTRMTGEIREYRDPDGRVIAFAHEVTKGKTIRGQWFYATDDASKSYVWFHSVQDLVRRAIEQDGIDVVDLGPSGSDAFSELKARYGFKSVDNWPAVADYLGPFRYAHQEDTGGGLGAILKAMEGRLF